MARNCLTVDVEEWFHICGVPALEPETWPRLPSRVEQTTRLLLDELDAADITGTFFIVGWIAERYPELVGAILAAGHDVGSHGFWHRRVYELNRAAFAEDLQATMQSLVGIFRTREDLEEAIDRLAGLRARWQRVRVSGSPAYNPGWNLTFELRSMLICSEAVARSALQRTESRGAHARVDFPEADAHLARCNSTVTLDGEVMRVSAEPLPEMPAELRGLVEH